MELGVKDGSTTNSTSSTSKLDKKSTHMFTSANCTGSSMTTDSSTLQNHSSENTSSFCASSTNMLLRTPDNDDSAELNRDSFVSVNENGQDNDFYQCLASPAESPTSTNNGVNNVASTNANSTSRNSNPQGLALTPLSHSANHEVSFGTGNSNSGTIPPEKVLMLSKMGYIPSEIDGRRASPASKPEGSSNKPEKQTESASKGELMSQLMAELSNAENLSPERMREIGLKLLASGDSGMKSNSSFANQTTCGSTPNSNSMINCIDIDDVVDDALDALDRKGPKSMTASKTHSSSSADPNDISRMMLANGFEGLSNFDGTSIPGHAAHNQFDSGSEYMSERKREERRLKKKKKPRLPCKYCEIHYPGNAWAHTTKMCFHLNKNGKSPDDPLKEPNSQDRSGPLPTSANQTFPCQFCVRRYPQNAHLHSTEMCFHLNKGGSKNREQIASALNAAAKAEAAAMAVGVVPPNRNPLPVKGYSAKHDHMTKGEFPCRYCMKRNPLQAMDHSTEMCQHAGKVGSNMSHGSYSSHRGYSTSTPSTRSAGRGGTNHEDEYFRRYGIPTSASTASGYSAPGSSSYQPSSTGDSEMQRSYEQGNRMRQKRQEAMNNAANATLSAAMEQYYAAHYYNQASQVAAAQQAGQTSAPTSGHQPSSGYTTSYHNDNNPHSGMSSSYSRPEQLYSTMDNKTKEGVNKSHSDLESLFYGHEAAHGGASYHAYHNQETSAATGGRTAYDNFGIPSKEAGIAGDKPPGL